MNAIETQQRDRSIWWRSRALLLVLLGGLVIRLWAMQWPPLPIDMNAWIAWGERMLQVGPARFYSPDVFADYAPGYLYVLWLTAAIKNLFFANADVTSYYFLIRIVPVVCDLATAVLIFAIVRDWINAARSTEQRARIQRWLPTLAAALYAFNPAIAFNSATWSQVDSTFTLLLLLALVLLLRDQAEWAVISYVIAFLIKPQSISLAPLIGVVLLLRYPPSRWLTSAAIGLSLMFSLIFPFFGWRSFVGLIQQLRGSVETYPYTSLFTYNLWGLYGFWKDDTVPLIAGVSLRSIGTALYGIGLIYGIGLLVRHLRRGPLTMPTMFAFGLYFAFLPVMVLTRMHERYLFPVLPLLLVVACTAIVSGTPRRWAFAPLIGYLVMTALFTINLLQVYLYYIYFDSGVPRSNTFFYFVDERSRLWSALMLGLFAIVVVALPWWLERRQMRSDHVAARIGSGEFAQ